MMLGMNQKMFESSYGEMMADTSALIRDNERLAFERSIDLLKIARDKGRGSRESVEALVFANRLWSVLLSDLADADNGYPDTLKASLISIGIWILRQTEEIRQGHVDDFTSLIEVSETISRGLRQR
jgi:flagellar biosynthesis activator protein FlaF